MYCGRVANVALTCAKGLAKTKKDPLARWSSLRECEGGSNLSCQEEDHHHSINMQPLRNVLIREGRGRVGEREMKRVQLLGYNG
jgi:hypothetical protein